MTTIKTVKQTDIHEKNQFYVVIQNNEKRKVINVGEKTYNEVNSVIEEKPSETIQTKLEVDEPNKNTTGDKVDK